MVENAGTEESEIATKHLKNYGWHQCKLQNAAKDIYDAGGTVAIKKLWTLLKQEKNKLTDQKWLNYYLYRHTPQLLM